MIYSIPLDDIESKMILSEGQVRPDLQTSLFSVRFELRTLEPVKRVPEPRTWMFDNENDIMAPEV